MATPPGQVFDFTVQNNSLIELIKKIDSFTDVGFGGTIGIIILLVVGFSLFSMMRFFGNERAFPVAMLVTSIIGLLLRIVELVSDQVFWISVGLLIISAIMLIREQGQFD